MGKKSRSKKQQSKQQQPKPTGQRAVKDAVPASLMGGAMPVQTRVMAHSKVSILDIQTDYIRTDIVRILVLLAAIAMLIGIIFVIGEQTDYLKVAGKELSRFFRLQ